MLLLKKHNNQQKTDSIQHSTACISVKAFLLMIINACAACRSPFDNPTTINVTCTRAHLTLHMHNAALHNPHMV